MNSLMLFMWLSLIVILHVHADNQTNDYSKFCSNCTYYPHCSLEDPIPHFNITVYCHNMANKECSLGIVQSTPNEKDQFTNDFICLLQKNEMNLEHLNGDGIKVISILQDHAMSEKPSALQLDAEEDDTNVEENLDGADKVQEAVEETADEAVEEETAVEVGTATEGETAVNVEKEEPTVPQTISENTADSAEIVPTEEENVKPFVIEETVVDADKDASIETPTDPKVPLANETMENIPTEIVKIKPDTVLHFTEVSERPVLSEVFTHGSTNTESIDYQGDETVPATIPVIIPALKCYSCGSDEDPNCRMKPDKPRDCAPVNGQKNACFTWIRDDSNVMERGCFSDFMEGGQIYCKSHPKSCTVCSENGCNNHPVKSQASNILVQELSMLLLGIFIALKAGSF